MNRRELLASLGGAGAALAAFPPDRLWAEARTIRHQAGQPLGPFSAHEAATVARISELIIPRTDTAGAIEAGVPEFIATIVGEWYLPEDKALMLAGLADVDTRSRRQWNGDFIALEESQQVAILAGLDGELEASRQQKESTEKNFFQRFKGLTLYGYYTSEPGMKEELQYAVIPGRYDPCAPMRPR
jgi:gluconate 2-dehydrogenase gamma chain